MELIVINSEKMKIILDKDDMKKLNISAEDLDYGKTETKRILWNILSQAKDSEGFDTDNSKLYVQVFPSADGGCEMFVTKQTLPAAYERNTSGKNTFKIISKTESESIIIIIHSFKELCEVCKRLNSTSPLLYSTLYRDPSNIYILKLSNTQQLPTYYKGTGNKYPDFISEYGEVKPYCGKAESYINEHCESIIEKDAIRIIAKYS